MFLKKRYRVTTRGKVVFSLTGLLLLYGIYMMLIPPPENPVITEPTLSEQPLAEESTSLEETDVDQVEEMDIVETEEVGLITQQSGDSTKIENCTTNKTFTSEEELKLIEAAGFTIYYEPNAYYVPEGDIALIAEFVSVAQKYPEEQIVIEGNVNKSNGSEEEWDTEDVSQLGYTRGLVIKNDLIKRGIDKERIIIYNNKDEKPLHVDSSKKSIALNRRVDVFFSQFMYNEIDTK
jgi:outer membrane protein OmpA-like peptidoglycan-associated protein